MNTLSTPESWERFLKTFAAASGAREWPGNAGATESQLLKVESRLRIKLPPSYRAFALASNGWRNPSNEVPLLKPVEKLRWFKSEHREWVQAYLDPMRGTDAILPAEQDYFNYVEADPVNFDSKHLAQALCVSEVGDGAVLLLNPMVIWPDGEWETWFFANWLPGAQRYRSFADWMSHELAGLTDETFTHSVVLGELPTVYLDGPAKSPRRTRPREEVLTFEEALRRLSSKTRSRRVKAVRHLAKIGDHQAIQALLSLLKGDYDYHVRCEAAEMLGRMQATDAISLLIEVTAEKSYVTSTAIQALGNFTDEASARRLVSLVEEDGSSAGVAAYALAKRNDPRGVPVLVQRLVSKEPRDQHTGNIAGRYIANFEQAGYQALEPLTVHEDAEIRRRAINGISDLAHHAKDNELKIKARQLLKSLLKTESDEGLRYNLEIYIAVACNKKSPGSDNPFVAA